MPTIVKARGWTKAPSGIYRTSGTQILDPAGQVFTPFGANTAIKQTNYSYAFEWPPNSTDTISGFAPNYPHHIGAAKAWGWNFLRINAVPWNIDPGGPTPGGNGAAAADLMNEGMTQLLDAGFVVMLASHSPIPGGYWMDINDQEVVDRYPGNPDEFEAGDHQRQIVWGDFYDLRIRAFWTRAIELWGDRPNFWINPFNEPSAQEGATGAATLVTLYTEWLGFLRSLDYEGPIVWDVTRQGQAIDDVARGFYDSFMALDPNMILSWHGYGVATGSASFTLGGTNYPAYSVTKAHNASLAAEANARGHCILIGEFGETIDGTTATGNVDGQQNVVEWALTDSGAEALNMGMVCWHSGHDAYSLIVAHPSYSQYGAGPFWNYQETSPNGVGLDVTHARSPFGIKVWDKGQALNVASHIVVP